MRSLTLASLISLITLAPTASADGWFQWGRNARHESAAPVAGHDLHRIEAEFVLDPFADAEKTAAGGVLLVHYQVPLSDGNDLYNVVKSGTFVANTTRDSQIWNVQNLRRTATGYVQRWLYESDWKPVPSGGTSGPRWEPVYHTAVTADAIWAPGRGGTIDKISRDTGARLARFNPFGEAVDTTIYVTGPPTADDAGNIYYNAMQVATTATAWTADPAGSWLVKIAANGTITKATYASLTPDAPAAGAQCTSTFSNANLPWPPTPAAVAPTVRCGAQRPGVNVAPAIAADGTIYTVSRAHGIDRWSYLIAANADLSPKWTASLRTRMNDGCNVLIPRNGTPGGCREGATTGVDPSDNLLGSGTVRDDSTSSPVVAPDGAILYGAYTRYNYSQGHLMKFSSTGQYLASYQFGWDLTPAIWEHDGTYSVLLKENRYSAGSYCGGSNCPANRSTVTPNDPESYYITQLDSNLAVEWKFRGTETKSCERQADGSVTCVEERPAGFEWCVNAIAVDNRGVVYANSEDGHLYAINQGGHLRQRLFLHLALGAAYTPLSIGADGRILTQNDGRLFIVSGSPRQRSVKKP
jgi:hypothetical protein